MSAELTPPGELLAFLKSEDNFLIVCHLNPDGDALGSAAALSVALGAMGKKTVLLCRDAVPAFYEFLPGSRSFFTFSNAQASGIPLQEFGNLILVDCNEIGRTGMERSPLAHLSFRTTVVIDHHETESVFGDIRWVIPETAATGMMIHAIIRRLGVALTKDMAINLYAALVVDTGNFRFENTTPEVLKVAAALAEAGAVPHMIHGELNETWSGGRFRLFARVMNSVRIEDGIAIIVLTKRMFEDTSTSADDTENFVSFPMVMRDITISFLLREVDCSDYKVSLRSKGAINVARIAEAFGGGGHKNAAGCNIKADLGTAEAEVLKRIREQLKNSNG
ncbi:MAG TPA: bifunctional oligoribonuclease/PAP phosphatase NrnA [Dissulfurispiraceae bacterium]